MPQAVTSHPSLPLRVPKELWRLVDDLFRRGVEEENLFLEKGLRSEVEALREALDTGTPFPQETSVHSVAETLVQFLADTTEPVVPFGLYQAALDASTSYTYVRNVIFMGCRFVISLTSNVLTPLFSFFCFCFVLQCRKSGDRAAPGCSLSDLCVRRGLPPGTPGPRRV